MVRPSHGPAGGVYTTSGRGNDSPVGSMWGSNHTYVRTETDKAPQELIENGVQLNAVRARAHGTYRWHIRYANAALSHELQLSGGRQLNSLECARIRAGAIIKWKALSREQKTDFIAKMGGHPARPGRSDAAKDERFVTNCGHHLYPKQNTC